MNPRNAVIKAPVRHTLTLVLLLCLLCLLLLGLTWSAVTLAASGDGTQGAAHTATLATTPDKCISLRKGQTCYQNIQVRWTASKTGDYCLMQQDRERPVNCWQNASSGSTRYRFVAKTASWLQLLDMSSGQELVSIEIKLAWVYKERKRSKRSWRLF